MPRSASGELPGLPAARKVTLPAIMRPSALLALEERRAEGSPGSRGSDRCQQSGTLALADRESLAGADVHRLPSPRGLLRIGGNRRATPSGDPP